MNSITKTGLSPANSPNRDGYDPSRDMRKIDFQKYVDQSPDPSPRNSESSEPSRGCNGSATSSSVGAPPASPASSAAASVAGSTSSQAS
jgi:hypothetical protein